MDTNVVVSALLTETGPPAQIVELCLSGDIELIVDSRIVAEYREVLARTRFGFEPVDVNNFLEVVAASAHVVAAPLPFRLADPDDQPFLEIAVACGADALVTGNVRHFRLAEGRLDIAVVTPRRLLDLLARS